MDASNKYSGKLCGECDEYTAAKYVKRDPKNGAPVSYLCGKHMGIHRRYADDWRGNDFNRAWHKEKLEGYEEMTLVWRSESVVNADTLRRQKQHAREEQQRIVREARRLQEIMDAPEEIRTRITKGEAYRTKKVEQYSTVKVESTYWGVQIDVCNFGNLTSREQAEALVARVQEAIPLLEEKWAQWAQNQEQILLEADAKKAALLAEQAQAV
jgi:hypothetical protein